MPSPVIPLGQALTSIIALCENPHWTADRKSRIVELARGVQQRLESIKYPLAYCPCVLGGICEQLKTEVASATLTIEVKHGPGTIHVQKK